MLRGAGVFYVTALVASVLGFGAVAVVAGLVAKVLFFVFLALFLFTLSAGLRSSGAHRRTEKRLPAPQRATLCRLDTSRLWNALERSPNGPGFDPRMSRGLG